MVDEVILLKYFLEKLRATNFEDIGFLNRENIIIGETFDWRGKSIEYYPRIELLLSSFNGLGEVTNVSRDEAWIFQVGIFLYRDKINFTDEDYFNILNFGKRVKNVFYMANRERQIDDLPCPNFLKVNGYPQMDIEGELYKQVASCLLQITVEVTASNF